MSKRGQFESANFWRDDKQVKVTRFTPPTLKTNGAIVYAHGGGYVAGSVKLGCPSWPFFY